MNKTMKIMFLDEEKGWVEDTLEVDESLHPEYHSSLVKNTTKTSSFPVRVHE